MTTIAYKHPYIAYDSLSTKRGIVISGNENKMFEGSGMNHFLCGKLADCQNFANSINESPAIVLYACESISVDKEGGVFGITQNEEGFFALYPISQSCNYSIGSGCDFAMAAMDLGKSAKESVEYAATRDIYTGGTIRVFNIETMKDVDV